MTLHVILPPKNSPYFCVKLKGVIQTKLLLLEYATVNDSAQNHWKLTAIRGIKNLLTLIDFNAETVPTESSEKLKTLLTSLKGKGLTKEEGRVIEELTTIE